MNNKLFNVLIFSVGISIGSIITYFKVKEKFEKKSQEDIDAMREHFEKRYSKETPKKKTSTEKENVKEKKKTYEVKTDEEVRVAYNNFAKKYNKESKEEKVDEISEEPYSISPDDLGNKGYEVVDLTYYENGYLVEDLSLEIMENPEEYIGKNFIKHFGDYEENVAFIRNDILETDYEILYEAEKYENENRF